MDHSKYDVEGLKDTRNQETPFDHELEEIPYYMRERVAKLIQEKVEKKVSAHMSAFKEEVMREIEDQRI